MYYFIVNPNSRSGAGAKIWKIVRDELHTRNIEYKVYYTECVGHAVKISAQITAEASAENPIHLIGMGGDGTVQEIMTGIQNFDHVYFGFIPTGSGNDFCRSLHLPQDPVKALDSVIKKEKILIMDVPYVKYANGKKYRFGISTGIGYDAAVCQEVAASSLKKVLNRFGLGKLVYLVIALKQLMFCVPTPLTLEMDSDRKISFKKVYFAAIMNVQYEGGGFQFCPNAEPDDETLDIILAEGLTKLKILFCLPTAFFGKHTRFKGIHTYRCKEVHVQSDVPLAIHRDGEACGLRDSFTVAFESEKLKVILPN